MDTFLNGHLLRRTYKCFKYVLSSVCHSSVMNRCFHSQSGLTLQEAHQHWNDIGMQQASKYMHSDMSAVPERFVYKPPDVCVRTCRILCTDRYIPFEEVRLRSYDFSSKTYGRSGGSLDYQSIERISGLPVEIDWRVMDKDFNNIVTVADAQRALPAPDVAAHGFDLLRVYLLAGQANSRTKPFYFAMENFVEFSTEIKQWLSSISIMADHLNTVSRDYEDDPNRAHMRLACDMNEYKRRFRGLLGEAWLPGLATFHIQGMITILQKHLMAKGNASQEMHSALKEACIMVNVLAPFTANKVWDILQLNTRYTSECAEHVQPLNDGVWPASHAKFETRWPLVVQVLDSDRMSIHYERSIRSASLLEKLDSDTIQQIALKSAKFEKRFGDLSLEVEGVSWNVDRVGTVIKALITVKSSLLLTERLSQLRI